MKTSADFKRTVLTLTAVTVLSCAATFTLGSPNFDVMRSSFVKLWGVDAVPKFDAWRTLISSVSSADESEKLKRVNDFFNRRIQFADSIDIWGDPDYWPTPSETLGRDAGNCTSFSLAKYYSLKLAGVASEKLRLVYVREKPGGGGSSMPAVAHMVVAYYAQPVDEPLILDNMISEIRPASRRPDLSPVFSFNEDGIFNQVSTASTSPIAGINRYSRWESFLQKASTQGYR